jgi:hypothetical protein
MPPEPTFDLPQAHRWFAVEFNNRAWDLVESSTRSADETSEMIGAAHAACLHWRAVGKPINQLRGECLLATVCASAGQGVSAVWHAEECLRLAEQLGEEQTAFDRATVQGCAANAYATVGEADRARLHYQKLANIVDTLTNAEERELLAKLYPPPRT